MMRWFLVASALAMTGGIMVTGMGMEQGEFNGSSGWIEFKEGETWGRFLGLIHDDMESGNNLPGPFTLTGRSMVMEIDNGTSVNAPTPLVVPTTETVNLDAHMVHGIEYREGFMFEVLSFSNNAHTKAQHTCADVRPSEHGNLAFHVFVDHLDRTPEQVNTASAVQLSGCDRAGMDLTIRGDFKVALWEWDVVVSAPDGTDATYRSGAFPMEGDASLLDPYVNQIRQIWIDVQDGELRTALSDKAQVFMDDARSDVTSATLHSVRGNLSRPGEPLLGVGGDRMRMGGDLHFEVGHHEDLLDTIAVGSFSEIEVDGAVLLQDEETAGNPSGILVAFLLTTVALLGTGVVAYHSPLRPVTIALWHICLGRAEDIKGWNSLNSYGHAQIGMALLLKKKAKRAIPRFTKSLNCQPYNLSARFSRALAYMEIEEYENALEDQESLEGFFQTIPNGLQDATYLVALNTEQAARTCVKLGRPDEAIEWLERLLSVLPKAYEDFDSIPEFKALEEDPRYQDLLRRSGGESLDSDTAYA